MKKTNDALLYCGNTINFSDITHVEGFCNYSILHLIAGKPIIVTQTLLRLAGYLPAFIRIHKTYLVNPDFITHYQRLSAHKVVLTLTTGEVLTVSRRRIADVIALLT